MNAFQEFIKARPFGFVTDKDMPELIRLNRLCQCVVRCGGCRFVCAAQDVEHLVKCVEAGGDYVRDVSITHQELERAAEWQPRIPRILHAIEQAREMPGVAGVKAASEPSKKVTLSDSVWFNEGDCGGVWDGRQVSSDADSGL